jgi:CRISPR-associated endonuclease/helicase Cas3
LIVCNHVPSAQLVYDEVRRRIEDTLLLHSRFCKRDRNRIENRISKNLPKVLVSTQVVEVSLDIDFELGFTEPAPIDALVQRLGRINRFGRQRKPAAVRIFREQLHNFNIYDADITRRSLQELGSLSNPLTEQDLVEAANRVYLNGYTEENRVLYNQALNHPRIREFENLIVSGAFQNWVDEVMIESDGTIDMLPISLLQEYEQLDRIGLSIEADGLLVPVPSRVLHYMNEVIDRRHEPWIINVPYSQTSGLSLHMDANE